jgi:hypothetical protein
LSVETQIIVNIKFLGAFSVVSDTLNFLEESKKSSSERVQAKRETKSSEREVQVSDSSERVADKPSSVESNCNQDLPAQGDLI